MSTDRASAQRAANRIRILREELQTEELRTVLALTPEQQSRFEIWSKAKLDLLARDFDVDISSSEARLSWGMRIASTIGALALCAAIVLFFDRYWGFLQTPVQVAILMVTPLLLVVGAETASKRERVPYFTGLLALLALASFILDLSVVGSIFNIFSTESALLAWGAFALLVAYRYGLRLMLAIGLLTIISYVAAFFTARLGYAWLDFYERPEHFLLLGLLVFTIPSCAGRSDGRDFAAVYRLVGTLVFFIAMLSLADWGAPSYLPWHTKMIERCYEIVGLILSALLVWFSIRRNWGALVNMAAIFFAIFLFSRLYHWWWDWMPRYLFFGLIGVLGIILVIMLRALRKHVARASPERAVA